VILLLDDRLSKIGKEIEIAQLKNTKTVDLDTGDVVNRLDWIAEQQKESERWVSVFNKANVNMKELKRLISKYQ
jgi:hypothetical protein